LRINILKKEEKSERNQHYQVSPGNFLYVESFSKWDNSAYKFTLETIKDHKIISKLSASVRNGIQLNIAGH
jgi:hypothetical protein